jgi:hypothetical protein
MANHYLSWNVSNKLNLGFFESVVWTNTNDRGFDVNFVNHYIFLQSSLFAFGRSGNAFWVNLSTNGMIKLIFMVSFFWMNFLEISKKQ